LEAKRRKKNRKKDGQRLSEGGKVSQRVHGHQKRKSQKRMDGVRIKVKRKRWRHLLERTRNLRSDDTKESKGNRQEIRRGTGLDEG